ncbi:MAG: hypothetical protein ACJ74U_15150 [Jatrophihabitantaceae bacterium]
MSVELVGPFKSHRVLLNGYEVPYLSAMPIAGGKVLLELDSRYMIEVDAARLDSVVEFMANRIAVASGYTCHPGTPGAPEPIPRSVYHRCRELTPLPAGVETS